MRRIACISILVLAVLGLGAQESGEGPDIGTVDVTAQVYSPLVLAPAGSVLTLGEEEIARSGAMDAADLLQKLPGISVRRLGTGSAQASVTIQGSSADQVLVIVDGVRINDTLQGGADLSLIPASSIAKIEVLEGGASSVYGADAVGGAILITTKRGKPGSMTASISNIAYPLDLDSTGATSLVDGQRFTLDVARRFGLVDVGFGAEGERSAGAFAYDAAGSSATRQNADFSSGSGRLSLGMPLLGGRSEAMVSAVYRETGVPGPTTSLTPAASETDSSLRGSVSWQRDDIANGAFSISALAHGSGTSVSSGDPSPPYPWSEKDSLFNGGLDLRTKTLLGESSMLGSGLSLSYDSASIAPQGSPKVAPTRYTLGAYVEPTFLLGQNVKMVPALRYDFSTDYTPGLSSMLGLVWQTSANLDVRLSGGRSYRAPTFINLYYPGWGNPDLQPETAWSGELGADFHGETMTLSVSAFARDVSNLIQNSMTGPMNLAAAFIPGVDCRFSLPLGRLRAHADYEFLYPLDLSGGHSISDGVVLKTISMQKLNAGIDLHLGAATLGLDGRFWSDHLDAYTKSAMPAVVLVDLSSEMALGNSTHLLLSCENLLDASYEIADGYPMPGLTLKLGMRLAL